MEEKPDKPEILAQAEGTAPSRPPPAVDDKPPPAAEVVQDRGTPKLADGTLDKDRIRDAYMGAAEIDFDKFLRGRGWGAQTAREVPHAAWKKEKRAILGRRQAEGLADAIFDHKFKWHEDVLRTLKELPKLHDTQINIIQFAQLKMMEVMAETKNIPADQKRKPKGANGKEQPAGFFNRVKVSDVVNLSMAIASLTTSKHRALLLDKWSLAVAEDHSVPEAADEAANATRPEATWNIKLMGSGELTSADLQKLMAQYYDPAHTPEPVDAPDQGVAPETPDETPPPAEGEPVLG